MSGPPQAAAAFLLPGAIGEMVLLAVENGATRLLLPEQNREDTAQLPPGLLRDIEVVHFDSPSTLVREVLG